MTQIAAKTGRKLRSHRAAAGLPQHDFKRSTEIIYRLCTLAASLTFLEDIQLDAQKAGIRQAVADHDTPKIFDWLLTAFSYQGISDRVARDFMTRHGTATWDVLAEGLAQPPRCSRLHSYWQFDGCRFDKGSFTCSEPESIDTCPLPRHRLRNGRLNQTAYSFYLFVRDIAGGDLVGWINRRLAAASDHAQAVPGPHERLLEPLRQVYGVSDKILTMSLSGLLIGAANDRPAWFDVGIGMVAVDTLVHNFLHRTGIIDDCGISHAYGAACYGEGGCAAVIRSLSDRVDARAFNKAYPANFPRFIQHAIWRYCAGDGLNVCNGNRIDDQQSCKISDCRLSNKCSKKSLKRL